MCSTRQAGQPSPIYALAAKRLKAEKQDGQSWPQWQVLHISGLMCHNWAGIPTSQPDIYSADRVLGCAIGGQPNL